MKRKKKRERRIQEPGQDLVRAVGTLNGAGTEAEVGAQGEAEVTGNDVGKGAVAEAEAGVTLVIAATIAVALHIAPARAVAADMSAESRKSGESEKNDAESAKPRGKPSAKRRYKKRATGPRGASVTGSSTTSHPRTRLQWETSHWHVPPLSLTSGAGW